MVWSSFHDEMLFREIMVVDPFTGTKKSTVARGKKREEVAENLEKTQQETNKEQFKMQPLLAQEVE